jgi:hypothetical protein
MNIPVQNRTLSPIGHGWNYGNKKTHIRVLMILANGMKKVGKCTIGFGLPRAFLNFGYLIGLTKM